MLSRASPVLSCMSLGYFVRLTASLDFLTLLSRRFGVCYLKPSVEINTKKFDRTPLEITKFFQKSIAVSFQAPHSLRRLGTLVKKNGT